MIFASSGGASYGECAGPASEDAPFLPLSPYGIAKKCGEEYLAGWNRIHGTCACLTSVRERLRAAAGLRPRGRRRRDLPRAACSQGRPTTIFGDGGHSRDYVYVDDVVAALLAAVGQGGGAVQRR